MGVEVVALGPGDWQRWREIRLASLRDAPDAFWSTVDDEVSLEEDAWRARLDRDDATVFVATRDGVDVGCAVAAAHHATSDVAGLYAMWVAGAARGTGASDDLLRAVIDWARSRSYELLRFDVADDNAPARALYARHGAVPTGDRAVFPPPRDHITEHELEIRL